MRIDALIYSMCDKADKIVKTLSYATGEDKTKYDTIIAKFEDASESIEQYYSDLYELLFKCNYPEAVTDDMLRDRFVLGLNDSNMQWKLLME